ncbi:MAG: conjugal transfer protein TraF [Aliivibrio sp.]|nr:conjugal transfer protein TraF [Aliivibrio sp.]
MKQWMKIGLLSYATVASSQASATNFSVDGRIDAMGGAGTAAADYLTGVFYNPALVAIYSRKDDAGLLLPSAGLQIMDQGGMVDDVDQVQKGFSKIPTDPVNGASDIENGLRNLNGDALSFSVGAGMAVAIPNRYLSMAFYGKTSVEGITLPDVYTGTTNPIEMADRTAVGTVALGLAEAGVAFAGYTNFLGQNITIGVTPKIQSYLTYTYVEAVNNFDFKDFNKNKTTDNAFNVDVGAVWFYGPWRFAAAGKNLIKNEIETAKVNVKFKDSVNGGFYDPNGKNYQYNYELTPTYTAGVAFMTNYFILTADMDLNEQERFVGLDDNVQMFRAGAEVDLLYQIQLRGGYKKDLAGTYDDAFTAGIGFSPLNMFHFDLAAIYSIDSTYGVSLNMAYEY